MRLDRTFGAEDGDANVSRKFLCRFFGGLTFLWITFITVILDSVFFAPVKAR